ncbi:MAG: adenosylmethionine--8-amino-7-oxononanoate transaminase, partial [Alphaproteobacteria bacterium]
MKTETAPLEAVSTRGVRIRLDNGRELIDGISSWWTACHGYRHPHIVAAMEKQLHEMPHIMFGGLTHAPAETLGRRLAAMVPGAGIDGADHPRHVFFTDSGSVAVEVALKMAVQYWLNRGETGRTRIVGFRHGYHGDTMAAMSVSDPEESMHKMFHGYLPEQFITDLPRDKAGHETFERLLAERSGEIAALIMEPLVQGAGGMKFHDSETLAAIAAACARHGVLLIADEIATGFGRTGTMFACDQAGVVPDILCVGKGLTGGMMSLAATLATGRVFDAFLSDDEARALMHGPTYMANPLACAAANASLDLFEDGERLGQVAMIETQLTEALAPARHMEVIIDVRIKGAIGVVQLGHGRSVHWMRRRLVGQ